jgi:LDH2 family malate/lactate/ureidoglycolate dehydrogenase
MIDVLAGALTGSPAGARADAHGHPEGGVGHLVIALRADLFVPRAELEARVEELLAGMQAAAGARVTLPGDPELAARERARREGIPVSDELAGQLDALAERLEVAPLVRGAG